MNGEGRAVARHRRRRVNQMMRPTTSVAPRTPPTTPPAIAPVLELFWFELELGLVEELDPDVDDVDADEAVDAVPSGESLAQLKEKKNTVRNFFFSMSTFSA
jgi:hypothetical protein